MLTLKTKSFKHYTSGILTLPDGQELVSMELPWKDNKLSVSCIPAGTYTIDRNKTGKHKWYAFRNDETNPRTYIEIHPASLISHLEGCIAFGFELVANKHTSKPVLKGSIKACEKLLELFGDNSWVLKIERC